MAKCGLKNMQRFPYPRKQLISAMSKKFFEIKEKNIKMSIVKKAKSKLFKGKTKCY